MEELRGPPDLPQLDETKEMQQLRCVARRHVKQIKARVRVRPPSGCHLQSTYGLLPLHGTDGRKIKICHRPQKPGEIQNACPMLWLQMGMLIPPRLPQLNEFTENVVWFRKKLFLLDNCPFGDSDSRDVLSRDLAQRTINHLQTYRLTFHTKIGRPLIGRRLLQVHLTCGFIYSQNLNGAMKN